MPPKKAYKNLDFLMSKEARPLRIFSEYMEPKARFEHYKVNDTVVFFGSARTLPEDVAHKRLEQARAGGDEAAIERADHDLQLAHYYTDAVKLAGMMTEWSKSLEGSWRRFIVCTGGGPGIMEAANRGASEAKGLSIGLGISLPMESTANEFITRELAFEFHYFFTRKFWFVYLAKALIVFPGGFGTMDELFELLTLIQTRKITKPTPIVLYGRHFWKEVVNFDALVRWGTISKEDLDLFKFASTPEEAFEYLKSELTRIYLEPADDHDA
jgi:uncharacterized protein (TIGR00730 family)